MGPGRHPGHWMQVPGVPPTRPARPRRAWTLGARSTHGACHPRGPRGPGGGGRHPGLRMRVPGVSPTRLPEPRRAWTLGTCPPASLLPLPSPLSHPRTIPNPIILLSHSATTVTHPTIHARARTPTSTPCCLLYVFSMCISSPHSNVHRGLGYSFSFCECVVYSLQ